MTALIKTESLSFSYLNRVVLPEKGFGLKNISVDIFEGDFISVIGKNGSGKSTLVKLISKILTGYSGKIFYRDNEIHSVERKEYSKNVSYLPQSTNTFNEDLTINEFLLLGRYAYKKFSDFRFSEEDRIIVKSSMDETQVNKLSGKYIYELSGGEKQKILITLSLVQLDITKNLDGKVLIIDEPLTYLDVNYQFEIFSILKKLVKRNLTVIIVIHDLNLALRFTDKTLLLNNGEMVKFSDTLNIINEDMLKEHFQIESKILNFEKNYFINYLP